MNYITEINGFERWLETNYLPSLAQLLWYKLIMLCNKAGWCEWVTVDNQRLMSLIQLKREATFIELRDKLIEAGLIEYRKGKKGCPNQYKINTFNLKVQTEVNTEVKSVVQTEVNTEVQTVDIYKQNKTNNIYFNLLKNAREKFDLTCFGGKLKARNWASEQEEWSLLSEEERLTFTANL